MLYEWQSVRRVVEVDALVLRRKIEGSVCNWFLEICVLLDSCATVSLSLQQTCYYLARIDV